jgi:hypothetical protein
LPEVNNLLDRWFAEAGRSQLITVWLLLVKIW